MHFALRFSYELKSYEKGTFLLFPNYTRPFVLPSLLRRFSYLSYRSYVLFLKSTFPLILFSLTLYLSSIILFCFKSFFMYLPPLFLPCSLIVCSYGIAEFSPMVPFQSLTSFYLVPSLCLLNYSFSSISYHCSTV